MISRGDRKAWAADTFRGLENTIVPSFTPDFRNLDEAGIRWDVRQSVAHGFFSIMCACETGLKLDEAQRFLTIVCDEAAGRVLVAFTLLFDSLEDNIAMLRHAEQAGATHAMVGYPTVFHPRRTDDVYRATAAMCEATDLGIVLYASEKFDHERFHPSSVPWELYDRLVTIPNAVGLKVGFMDPAMAFECFERYHEDVQVNIGNAAMLGYWPILRKRYRVQWGGPGIWEFWQSPEKPFVVEYADHVNHGRIDEAMSVYWHIAPATALARSMIAALPGRDTGLYGWPVVKYIIWSVGGNGGLTRKPAMRLTQPEIMGRKKMLHALGIPPREPDEEFYVGRVNYQPTSD
jgi:4-hydroxy-tetrahydrodipicolinate synthase